MASPERIRKSRRYLGVDIGGTKIQASLVEESGAILGREKTTTPRDRGPEAVLTAVERLIEKTMKAGGVQPGDLSALGMAIPGVVDPKAGHIVVTPNMSLSGVDITARMEAKFRLPVAVGNDCNLGALGEAWLGSARKASSAMAILVGTGIGGGFVRKGKVWRGARESAGEVGHMIMQIGGPKCGCGNRGCFEALASRTAIENQLWAGVAAGRKSILVDLLRGNLEIIRSSLLAQALAANDELVTEVVRGAAEILGYACLTIRHLIDPEVIVLGGGVIEACSDFVLPIVEGIVEADQLPGARPGGHVRLSALGDDAVVLGAVALARDAVGRSPFKKRYLVVPHYPTLVQDRFGEIGIDGEVLPHDVYLLADGNVKKRKKKLAKELYGTSHTVGPKEIERVCQGGPEVVFVGTGESACMSLNAEAQRYLNQRSIHWEAMPTRQMVDAYNRSKSRKAAIVHVTC